MLIGGHRRETKIVRVEGCWRENWQSWRVLEGVVKELQGVERVVRGFLEL